MAILVVGLMVLAGLILSVVQLESTAAMLTTGYGRIFLAKMAAVLCLLGLAALNRQRLTPLLSGKDVGSQYKDVGSQYLVRSIAGEIGPAVIILGLVATWRFTPPPPALMAPITEPVNRHIHTPQVMAEMSLATGQVGSVTMTMSLMTGDFGALNPKEVTVALGKSGTGIEPIERRAIRKADGTWQIEGLVLPVPGQWQVRVDVLISDFEKATLEDVVEFRP